MNKNVETIKSAVIVSKLDGVIGELINLIDAWESNGYAQELFDSYVAMPNPWALPSLDEVLGDLVAFRDYALENDGAPSVA
jgi:hypothetical protein